MGHTAAEMGYTEPHVRFQKEEEERKLARKTFTENTFKPEIGMQLQLIKGGVYVLNEMLVELIGLRVWRKPSLLTVKRIKTDEGGLQISFYEKDIENLNPLKQYGHISSIPNWMDTRYLC